MGMCKRTLVVLCVIVLAVSPVLTQAGAQGSAAVTYQFTEGEETDYRLKFSNHITIYAGQTMSDIMTHSYVFREKVSRIRPTGASIDVRFKEVLYKPGARADEFDSRNQEHRRIATGQNDWRIFGAILTSNVKMRVTPTGEVSFFRLQGVGPGYDDEKTKFYVTRMIEEVKNHAFLMFPPGYTVPVGGILPTFIPIKMVGGSLSGNTIYTSADLTLQNIETVGGERRANFRVTSYGQPDLGKTGDSIQGADVDMNVSRLDGSLVFSVDKGQIVSYDFRIKTTLKISMSGQLAQQHEMDAGISLERL